MPRSPHPGLRSKKKKKKVRSPTGSLEIWYKKWYWHKNRPLLLEIHMLKLKTRLSLLGTVVLWLICSLRWLSVHVEDCWHGYGGTDSFADVSLHDPLALLAGDVAAPVVLAVAALHQLLHVRVVATAAAHQVAAVTADRGFVALPKSSVDKKEIQHEMWRLT